MINVINLQRRPDRKLSLINHLGKLGIQYWFWDGYDDRSIDPFVNITQSHKAIVRDAQRKKLKSVTIAEDDLRFSHVDSFQTFVDNEPESYDLYFGMVYTGVIEDGRIVHGFSGMQLYMVHERFYDVFLSAPEKKHIDMWLGEQCHQYEYRCCDPFICYGNSGYSDNFKKQWVFEEKKLPRKLFNGR